MGGTYRKSVLKATFLKNIGCLPRIIIFGAIQPDEFSRRDISAVILTTGALLSPIG